MKSISSEVLDTIAQLVTAAFGLVAALAGNEAISAWIESVNLGGGPWVYAILVTIQAVLATYGLAEQPQKPRRN